MRTVTLFYFLLLAYTNFSCQEISYKETQPAGKKSLSIIPKAIQGSYLLVDTKDNSTDTLFVDASGYFAASDRKKKTLGNSLQIKFYKGYYFVNVNESPEWLLRIVKVDKNGDLELMSMPSEEKKFAELLKKLSKDVQIDSINLNNERLYQIDPKPKQLMNLLHKGYFSERVNMKKLR
ncbi:MAG: hypothetical protein ABJA70_01975 [Chryseolinea sp.]